MSVIPSILGKGSKVVVFQSRYRTYKIQVAVAASTDKYGRPTSRGVLVEFNNFMKVVEDTEENAGLIAILRKHEGTDYQEIDFAKKKSADDEKDKKIAELESALTILRNQPTSGTTRMRRAKAKAEEL